MDDAHEKGIKSPLKKKPVARDELPQWLIDERSDISTKLEQLNLQIASIPPDSSLKHLRAMMKETAKGLQSQLDEMDEFVQVKQPTHTLIRSKTD